MDERERHRAEGRGHDHHACPPDAGAGSAPGAGAGPQCQTRPPQEATTRRGSPTGCRPAQTARTTTCRRAPPYSDGAAPSSNAAGRGGTALRVTACATSRGAAHRGKAPGFTAATPRRDAASWSSAARRPGRSRAAVQAGTITRSHVPAGTTGRSADATAGAQARPARRGTAEQRSQRCCPQPGRNAARRAEPASRTARPACRRAACTRRSAGSRRARPRWNAYRRCAGYEPGSHTATIRAAARQRRPACRRAARIRWSAGSIEFANIAAIADLAPGPLRGSSAAAHRAWNTRTKRGRSARPGRTARRGHPEPGECAAHAGRRAGRQRSADPADRPRASRRRPRATVSARPAAASHGRAARRAPRNQ